MMYLVGEAILILSLGPATAQNERLLDYLHRVLFHSALLADARRLQACDGPSDVQEWDEATSW